MAIENDPLAKWRNFVNSLPSSPEEYSSAAMGELSPDLEDLLAKQDPFLLYAICDLIKPNHRTQGLVFTIKKIGYNFASQGDCKWEDDALEIREATECVVGVLLEQGIMVSEKDFGRKWPVGINAPLVFVGDGMKKAMFYDILAQFGEKAGVGRKYIDWHLKVSKGIRDTFVPVDDIGLR